MEAALRKKVAERWKCSAVAVFLWAKDDRDTRQNRVQAALHGLDRGRSELPEECNPAMLQRDYGLTKTAVAKFYGYHEDTISRFMSANTSRVWDLIDYILATGAHYE